MAHLNRQNTQKIGLILFIVLAVALASSWWRPVTTAAASDAELESHRNLGKAFFENPTTHEEAIAEFKKALDLAPNSVREKLNYALAMLHGNREAEAIALLERVQKLDPALPHTWFNLGIYYKKAGQPEKALAEFEQMVKLVPEEAIAHYQLCTLQRTAGKLADAVKECEAAIALLPELAGAHFQLFNLYRQTSRPEDAAKQVAIFRELKQKTEGAAIAEDVDWCNYGEIYDPPLSLTAAAAEANPVYDDRAIATAKGMLAIDAAGDGHTDLLAWSADRVSLYRNGAEPVKDSGLDRIAAVISIAAGDFDNDGLTDLCILTEAGPQLYRNTGGKFAPFDAALPKGRFEAALWVDYDHDYDLDLVLIGAKSALVRNRGKAGFEDRSADFPFAPGRAIDVMKLRVVPDTKAFDVAIFYSDRSPVLYSDLLGGRYKTAAFEGKQPVRNVLEADFDNDGRLDRATIDATGKLVVRLNRTAEPHKWLRIKLTGIKNLKQSPDALVEVKSGLGYWKQTYAGVPLFFDVGGNPSVEVVRITWPNGLIQNETNQATNKPRNYEESQRLSGSCPMIWTWNGSGFEFITDVLGVAPLGASDGEGSYFPVDHDEFVSIPGRALRPVDGKYEVRVTEELAEVSYLDQIRLIAIDHPAGKEIYTNEKFKSPPYPEDRLYEVSRRIYPTSARDDRGAGVLPLLLARDGRYPDSFPRSELGVAKLHTLELDFKGAAKSGDAVLLANGWVDWPDGSTFRAASQERKDGLTMPYLQMQDAQGRWVTVNRDMGMPAGKPKTIAVPLRFLSASRKLRIVTDLCIYWDEIFLSEAAGAAEVRQTNLALHSATLHYRGFSPATIDAARKQPDTFTYEPVQPAGYWNPTPGNYTRFGDVRELLGTIDDRMAIMGSGDELKLLFDGAGLPQLPSGWTRDFLLKVDGWAKDRDPNTAYSQTVEPLPFHNMSRYPYPPNEMFPNTRYQREYNTRPALRLLRPLDATH